MTYSDRFENLLQEREADCASERSRSDILYVVDLIRVLHTQPAGLRRWSVMRAIRKSREAVAREIPLKLESDVERAFRQFCRNDGMRASGTVLFCRPAEKAGEVWALDTGHASAGETPSQE